MIPKVIAGLMLCAAAYLVAVFGLQRKILFPAPPVPEVDYAASVPGLERWWLPGSQGRGEAWFLPPRQATGRSPLLIFAHGNGELIDDWASGLDTPRSWGMAVLLVEYPGYGRSTGVASEASIAEAMRLAYDRAVARPDIDPNRVVGYGMSLGGGALCALVGQRRLAALILQSTFTSVRAMAARFFVPGILVRDPFDNLAAVRAFDGPLLVVHGTEDSLVPVHHGDEIERTAARAESVRYRCGHNDCPPSWPEHWARVHSFLARHGVLADGETVGSRGNSSPSAARQRRTKAPRTDAR